MPDIFIPVEHNAGLKFYNESVNKGILYQFAFEYTDRNRASLGSYKEAVQFDKAFNVSSGIYSEYVAYAEKNQKLKVIGGSLDDRPLDLAGIKALATLPSLDQLRGKMIGLLQAPATKIAGVLQAPAAQLARLLSAHASKADKAA